MSLHGSPTSAELIESVREWLERDVMAATEGRLRFHARVAANVLATVERELAMGAEQEEEHKARLATLGMDDDAQLAAAIRNGDLDDRLDEVRDVVRADVAARLAVANPKYVS
ncbi:DUF6285 domain-containing protein [Ilumatobacter nonamiensis]|uniref:DUF6285 domain-containing protein n=1 Tax=Ilumatobacter nonamiensis TaxID=467093 RepID=UPI000345D6ED|nr:DUF6285 domain-containing protein [Ilumatobacter nonamiensis]